MVYNGITKFEVSQKEQAIKKLLEDAPQVIQDKHAQGARVLGNVAELVKNKGITYTLEAIKILKDQGYNIIYIHIGTGDALEELQAQVEQSNLEDTVYFAGFQEAKPVLSAFDILVFSSIKEGLPYVPIEAGYAGVPVVATRVGGIPEIVSDKESGLLVDPKHPEQTAQAIQDLIDNSDKRESYAQSLKHKVMDTFSIETMIDKTKAVYRV